MPWARFDDGFAFHPKVKNLSDRAFRLWQTSISHSAVHVLDGAITTADVRMLRALLNATKKHVDELIDAGLWDVAGDGFLIHDYLEYNPSREQVLRDREQARERKRKQREGQSRNGDGTFGHGESHGVTQPVRHGEGHGGSHTAPTRTRTKELKPLADGSEFERLLRAAKAAKQ